MKLYDALRSRTLRRTATTATLLALAGGLGAAFLANRFAPDTTASLALVAFLFGAASLATPVAAAGLVLHTLDENHRQSVSLAAIRPLMGDLPLPLGRWAIDPHFGELIVRTLTATRPALVVECGSGSSTVLAAECLRRIGSGRVLSFEHDAAFADESRRRIADRGLDAFARVVAAPVTDRTVDGQLRPWYAETADAGIDAPIDLLIVDGPPRQLRSQARYPAVPLLQHHLAPDATILMDDGNRPDETRIAETWARRLNASKTFVRGGKGAWILRLRGPT